MTEHPDCWKALAGAVIRQARDDYAVACAKLRFRPRLKAQAARKQSLEEFFLSGWVRILCDLAGMDAAALPDGIRKEAGEKKVNERKRRK